METVPVRWARPAGWSPTGAWDPLTDAPSEADDAQLAELHIRVKNMTVPIDYAVAVDVDEDPHRHHGSQEARPSVRDEGERQSLVGQQSSGDAHVQERFQS